MVPILFRCILVEKGSISIPHPTWNGNNPLPSLSKSGGKELYFYFIPSFVNSDSAVYCFHHRQPENCSVLYFTIIAGKFLSSLVDDYKKLRVTLLEMIKVRCESALIFFGLVIFVLLISTMSILSSVTSRTFIVQQGNSHSFRLYYSQVSQSTSKRSPGKREDSEPVPLNSADSKVKRFSSIFKRARNDGNKSPSESRHTNNANNIVELVNDVLKVDPIASNKAINKKKNSLTNNDENIDDLERVLQSKYGSSAFKAQFIEGEEDEELVIPKRKPVYDKFGGFGSAAGTKSERKTPIEPKTVDEQEDSDDSSFNWKGNLDGKPVEIGSSKPSNDVTYRLRKPNEVQSKQLEKDINIIRGITKPDNLKSSRNVNNTTSSKEAEKNAFSAFEFGSKKDKSSNQVQLFDTTKSFSDLGVSDQAVLENLEKMQIVNPTNIQVAALSAMLTPGSEDGVGGAGERREIVMQAQTGSGKTLAFLLPLLRVINPDIGKIQCLIIAPSRELVVQIGLVGSKLFAGSKYRIVPLIGGVNVRNQIKQLRDNKPQILVSTPGRLAELVSIYYRSSCLITLVS